MNLIGQPPPNPCFQVTTTSNTRSLCYLRHLGLFYGLVLPLLRGCNGNLPIKDWQCRKTTIKGDVLEVHPSEECYHGAREEGFSLNLYRAGTKVIIKAST